MPAEFIPVSEAKKLISEHIKALAPVKVSLQDAAGLILAEDVYSKTDLPPFNQSSMDGYALNYDDWQKNQKLKIEGITAAGPGKPDPLLAMHSRRIFTGAAVPPGADTVVMQEKVLVKDNELSIQDPDLMKGQSVRIQGSEIKAGELALDKNTLLSAAAIGYIAGLGVDKLFVYPKPSVSIILTGNELQQPGIPLEYGQVYESNSFALRAALEKENIFNLNIVSSEDNLLTLSKVLSDALEKSDLVLLTGGVSVGDYDFVIRAAQANEINQIFHKIRQRPGKPIYFGKKGSKYIFGLPGNPASVLSCFYEYVYPSLSILSNNQTTIARITAPLSASIKKTAGLTHFLKGYYDGKTVRELKAQESFRLSSFAKANCLIMLEEDQTIYEEGDQVEIHLLPGN